MQVFDAPVSSVCACSPRFYGSLERVNEALAHDILQNKKMSPYERQRVRYNLRGNGSYMHVPELLKELREEADHPVDEQNRIKRLHRLRRRGTPINMNDLKIRPFVKRGYFGPVTTTEIEEGLTEADMQQRQSAVNGWLKMQDIFRLAHRHRLRNRRAVPMPGPIKDDGFVVQDEDVLGLSFGAELSDEEGGEVAREYRAYLDLLASGEGAKTDETSEQQDSRPGFVGQKEVDESGN